MALTLANLKWKVNVPRGGRLMFTIDLHLMLAILTLVAFLVILTGHLVLSTIAWRRFSAQVSARRHVLMMLLPVVVSIGTYLVMLAVIFPIALASVFEPPSSGPIDQR